MNEKNIQRYCDKILRTLKSHPPATVLSFGFGKMRGQVEDDFLIAIGVPYDHYNICLERLKALDFITVYERDTGSRKEEGNDVYIPYGVGKVSITDKGIHFISNTSFTKAAFRIKWGRRVPNIISLVSVVIAAGGLMFTYMQYQLQNLEIERLRIELDTQMSNSKTEASNYADSLFQIVRYNDSINANHH